MGFLKHFRSRSHLKNNRDGPQEAEAQAQSHSHTHPYSSPPSRIPRGRDYTQRLPERVLDLIFAYTCPHSCDLSYDSSERSQIGDGCMLCDLRDLARCAQVCRKWYGRAQKALYTSVRIDAVHYCALEEELAERRRKAGKHFRSRSAVVEAGEIPGIRLSLLCRTVREQEGLAQQVLVLKLPYMTRETAKGELARCVSALPNLRYVDLPDGFYSGDPSCLALRQELQARCPDIRQMSYRAGSEEALELLAQGHWQSIEVLELSGLAVEPATLRVVLGHLPTLHELTLSDLPWVDDSIFQLSPGQLPDFPPLHSLTLRNAPSFTAEGLCYWLDAPQNREVMASLTLCNTGVTVQDLHHVLWKASELHHLSITETVHKSLGLATAQLPPLTSISLQTLHFEIASSEDVHGLQKPAESYYAYLASSLHQNALPGLSVLYVRDPTFPELLILPPIQAPFASEHGSLKSKPSTLSNSGGPGTGFNQTLEVFSKGLDELEWVFTAIAPPPTSTRDRGYSASGGRPLSAYSASRGLGPQWAQGGFGGEARKSVIVGNGFGGFLAVPQEEVPRPMTAGGDQRGMDFVGGTRWGSVGSQATAGSGNGSVGRASWLKPPPSLSSLTGSAGGQEGMHGRRGSRHDLWR
ncbi:hypothetical protein LTR62_005192 [Meristemomyces frigidus]|uniref:F-box domain-containing protein n=1 Tax=Meristemomyces frigidus TaxID=1508187 RepID=A0AAN7YR29_9PEZI|nr:hypothetical protein LTR62_005192 [Meristemomyces frigidus]